MHMYNVSRPSYIHIHVCRDCRQWPAAAAASSCECTELFMVCHIFVRHSAAGVH